MDYETFRGLQKAYNNDPYSRTVAHHPGQATLYRELMDFIHNRAVNYDDQLWSMKQILDRAMNGVKDWIDSAAADQINRLLPVLSDESLKELMSWAESQPMTQEWLSCLAASFIYETRNAQRDVSGAGGQSPTSLMLDAEVASYAGWSVLATTQQGFTQVFEDFIRKFQVQANELTLHHQGRLQELSEEVIKVQKNGGEATRRLVEAKLEFDQAAGTFTASLESAEQRLGVLNSKRQEAEAQLDAINENLKTLSVKNLWDKRASASNWGFWLSALVLAGFLIGIPLFAFYKLDAVLAVLKHIGDATMQGLPPDPSSVQLAVVAISRLVVITVPIALYIWVIRLIVRFNIRSLLLGDDARQRHTMMDTYFHLIEERAATKEDRALILAALFRPTPGQGPDNVEPPSFTDLIDRAMPK